MAAAVLLLLANNALDSWRRLAGTTPILRITEASSAAFLVLHNLRSDRSATVRNLNGAEPVDLETRALLQRIRDNEMPALRKASALVETLDFADRASLVPELQRQIKNLTALQEESWLAMAKPKQERREPLAKEYLVEASNMLETLDQVSARLFASIKNSDAIIDQMMAIKQLAWTVRNIGGEASLIVSNGIPAGRLAPELQRKYAASVTSAETAWSILETAAYGGALPLPLIDAIGKAKQSYFAPDHTALRDRLMTQLLAGEKPEMTVNQWSPLTIGRLASLLAVAERALDAARDRAEMIRTEAQWQLAVQMGELLVALALALGGRCW